MTDVLVVSLGTTRGLRVADSAFAGQVRAAGASVEVIAVRQGALGRLRRVYPVNDLVEAAAARRATASAVRRVRPRAVVFSSVTSAMMAPRLDVPYAVRLDSPASLNRPGPQNAVLHALERRALAGARLVLPWSRAALAALPPGLPSVILPPPITPSGEHPFKRRRAAAAYVPDPKAKGLELLIAAWSHAAAEDAELEVFGIEAERARGHLARTATQEPEGVSWRGLTPPAEFREALRSSLVFASAARWEDFGQAPLEALADGALLATLPAGGAYEALALARELAPELAPADLTPEALAGALEAAFAISAERAADYRQRAARALVAYNPANLERTVADEVLPALLSERWP
ncbi:MAG TPA: glycosyltransferase [Thermoleophilaceae bacterium]|nr:glycosyltransferase [Thermoleophilaceae bacterium]